jgi:hypothetical protein
VSRICIPQTGTTIDWPPADAGRIRIDARLHLSGQPAKPGIGIELSFKPAPFRRLFRRSNYWCYLRSYAQREAEKTKPLTTEEQAELDRFRPQLSNGSIEQLPPDLLRRQWGHDIAGTLLRDSYADSVRRIALRGQPSLKSPSRKPLQIIDGHFQTIDYRLRIDLEDLKSLRTVITTEAGASRLLFEAQWSLLPTALIDYALRGLPRGNKHAQVRHDLMTVVRCAVFVAERLVNNAPHDTELLTRLQKVLGEEDCGWKTGTLNQILTIADRTLRPALERVRLNPIIGRQISNILDPDARKSLAEFFDRHPNWLAWWFELLLGPVGQAARTLNLIK